MVDDFSNAPVSIGELRSEREQDASLWTPRDALVGLLRQIDRGEINAVEMVIIYRIKDADGTKIKYDCATSNGDVTLSMIERAKYHVMRRMYE